LNWLDRKVNQSQAFSNPFQNTLSVKQPVESKFQQVDFSLSFENTYFSKGLKSNKLGSSIRVDSNPTLDTHTTNNKDLHQSTLFNTKFIQTTKE